MANLLVELVSSTVELGVRFGQVATTDPLSALLLAVGAIFVLGASAVLGYLAAGAVLSPLMPDRSGPEHRRPIE